MTTWEPTHGLIAPPHSPLDAAGDLDVLRVETQAERFVRAGLVGVFVAGSTGEGASLSTEERQRLAARWVEVARGGPLKVIVHVGHNSLREAVELASHAAKAGADAVAATAPGYFKPRRTEELLDFLQPIAAAAEPLPFYYYDIPMLTGVTLPAAEVLWQGSKRLKNLRGLKYTNPDLVGLQQALAVAGAGQEILFGCDDLWLAALCFGCRGAVGVTYNFAAPLYQSIIASFETNDLEHARRRQYLAAELIRILSGYGYLAASKGMMSLIGADCGPCRAPLKTLSQQQLRALTLELEQAGLWTPEMLMFP